MAFRQSVPPPLSRRYSTPSQQLADPSALVAPIYGRSFQYEPHLGPISDFGSLNTIPQPGEEELSEVIQDVTDDLDSLDEGLQAFQEPLVYRVSDIHDGPILPAHDGLGSFNLAAGERSSLSQRDRHLISPLKRFSSFGDLQDSRREEESLESSRHERVERWRLEQSKVVLEEIEKERRRAEIRQHLQDSKYVSNKIKTNEAMASNCNTYSEEVSDESIWQRLARHVMRDFIGVDDAVLSAIFGEDLISEEEISKTPTQNTSISVSARNKSQDSSLLQSLIKELRQLAQGLSSNIPITQQQLAERFDYAGIPLAWLEDRNKEDIAQLDISASAQFKPTLQSSHTETKLPPVELSATESEYWEQTPNLKTVINYLYKRFRSAPTVTKQSSTSSDPLQRTQEAVYRAAIIQQHHPLTSRHPLHHHHQLTHSRTKKQYHHSTFLSFQKAGPTSLKRPGSSCASWSTKRSRRGESNGSRNYWDLGGDSFGSGSLVFAGAGAWGEF